MGGAWKESTEKVGRKLQVNEVDFAPFSNGLHDH